MRKTKLKLLFVFCLAVTLLLTGCRKPDRAVNREFLSPEKDFFAVPTDFGMKYKEVVFYGKNKAKLHGWFIPGASVDMPETISEKYVVPQKKPRPTILICPGNAGNHSRMVFYAQFLHKAGFNVFCFDYRGFGESTEKINMKWLVEDAVSAYDHMITLDAVDRHRTGIFGVSLGSIIAAAVTSRRPEVRGLVMEGSFLPHKISGEIMRYKHPDFFAYVLAPLATRATMPFGNNVSRVIRNIKCPLFMAQGDRDKKTPLGHAAYIYSMAKHPKTLWVIEDCGHPSESLIMRGREYPKQVVGFLYNCFDNKFIEKWRVHNWQSKYVSTKKGSELSPEFKFYVKPKKGTKFDEYMVTMFFGPGKNYKPKTVALELSVFSKFGMLRKKVLYREKDKPNTRMFTVPGKPIAVGVMEYNNYSVLPRKKTWMKSVSDSAHYYRVCRDIREQLEEIKIYNEVKKDYALLDNYQDTIDKALEGAPKKIKHYFARLYFILAECYEELDKSADAIDCWEKCIDLLPENIERYYEFGAGTMITKVPKFYRQACVKIIAHFQTPRGKVKQRPIEYYMVLLKRLTARTELDKEGLGK